jgi:hypothetical protein
MTLLGHLVFDVKNCRKIAPLTQSFVSAFLTGKTPLVVGHYDAEPDILRLENPAV